MWWSWGRVGLKGFQDTWNIEMVIKGREMSVRLVTGTMGEVGLSKQRVQPAERHRSPTSGRKARTVRIGKVGFHSFAIAVGLAGLHLAILPATPT